MGNAFTLLLLMCFGLGAGINHHNDLFVAVGNQIDWLTTKGARQLDLGAFNASTLVALAYNPTSSQLFFSDAKHTSGHIFSTYLDQKEESSQQSVQHVVQKSSQRESAESLTYDPVDKWLMWTDGQNQSIRRIRVVDDLNDAKEISASVQVVHLLNGDKPRGLVCDPCTRMLYWTNWNTARPTIERSHLNGSDRQVIVHKDLYMPHGLGLDVKEQRIYWVNNMQHGSFQIERSFVDGSARQVVYHGEAHKGRGQFIYGLTIGDNYVYWTDWDSKTLYSFPKDQTDAEPTALRQYGQKPMAVAVFQHEPINCLLLSSEMQHVETTVADEEERFTTTASALPVYQDVTNSICLPGYCLNGGRCFSDDAELINCSCPDNFSGERCELPNTNASAASGDCILPLDSTSANSSLFVALISLSVTCVLLMVSVIVLSARVWQLSRGKYRPRVKRRKLGRFSAKFDPQLAQPSNAGHVIAIEDCCNMNICETPCTDPSMLNSRADSKANPSDRIKLLNCQF